MKIPSRKSENQQRATLTLLTVSQGAHAMPVCTRHRLPCTASHSHLAGTCQLAASPLHFLGDAQTKGLPLLLTSTTCAQRREPQTLLADRNPQASIYVKLRALISACYRSNSPPSPEHGRRSRTVTLTL